TPGVAEALADAAPPRALGPLQRYAWEADQHDRPEANEITQHVQVEIGREAPEGEGDAGQRWADDCRALPDHRVQRERGEEGRPGDQAGNQRLPGRVAEAAHGGRHKRVDVD